MPYDRPTTNSRVIANSEDAPPVAPKTPSPYYPGALIIGVVSLAALLFSVWIMIYLSSASGTHSGLEIMLMLLLVVGGLGLLHSVPKAAVGIKRLVHAVLAELVRPPVERSHRPQATPRRRP